MDTYLKLQAERDASAKAIYDMYVSEYELALNNCMLAMQNNASDESDATNKMVVALKNQQTAKVAYEKQLHESYVTYLEQVHNHKTKKLDLISSARIRTINKEAKNVTYALLEAEKFIKKSDWSEYKLNKLHLHHLKIYAVAAKDACAALDEILSMD